MERFDPIEQKPKQILHVGQGEFAVADDPSVVLSTLLGSCVSTCLFDPISKVGGLNHIILPNDLSTDPFDLMVQVNAMECLINALLKQGAMRSRLVAKVFGGSNMIGSLASVGEKNTEFVFSFLNDESISVEGQDVGGTKARNIRFEPTTGRVRLKVVIDQPIEVTKRTCKKLQRSELELF